MHADCHCYDDLLWYFAFMHARIYAESRTRQQGTPAMRARTGGEAGGRATGQEEAEEEAEEEGGTLWGCALDGVAAEAGGPGS